MIRGVGLPTKENRHAQRRLDIQLKNKFTTTK